MTQTILQPLNSQGLHVGIIMDGNGRWASARGLPRTAGHRAGAKAVRRAVEGARRLGVGTLSLYAFSSDNWRRPAREVHTLMGLLAEYLEDVASGCAENGIRLNLVGRRDRLPQSVLGAAEKAEATTSGARDLHLRIAVDYSSREAIVAAAQSARALPALTPEVFSRLLAEADHGGSVSPVDLVIRTSGEKRLSDFLLWECAYAEFYFLDKMWPEFTEDDLARALAAFAGRHRRFGGLSAAG